MAERVTRAAAVFQTRARRMRLSAPSLVLLALAAAAVVPLARAQQELGGPGMDDLRNQVGL